MTSFRIGSIRGIPIRIHLTFLLILPLLAFAFGQAYRRWAEAAEVPPEQLGGSPWLWGLVIAVSLFASVLVHELAHSLYALHKGGRVRDITLMMIGGVSQMSEAPKRPRHEAVMALVGPVSSVALGFGFVGIHLLLAGTESYALRFAAFQLGVLNLFIGVFNLLPAFPMDGGRILRALLTRKHGVVGATRIAATVGKGFAVLFGILGALSLNFILLLIAFFVWAGAEGEARGVVVKEALAQQKVRDIMRTDVGTLSPWDTVADAAERMIGARRTALAVVDAGRPLGIVTKEGIRRVAQTQRDATPVREIAREAQVISPDAEAGEALHRMVEHKASALIVAEGEQVLGILTQADFARALELSELRVRRPSRGREPLEA